MKVPFLISFFKGKLWVIKMMNVGGWEDGLAVGWAGGRQTFISGACINLQTFEIF